MMKTVLNTALTLLAFLVVFWLFIFLKQSLKQLQDPSPTQGYIENLIEHSKLHETKGWKNLQFDLMDPEEAPQEIRDLVEIGYRLVTKSHELLNGYVGDRLDCSNCHFAGGITTGGVNGGISLAGVAAKYPHYDKDAKTVIDLPMRINNCFTKSMNGKPLPLDSKEMLAIVTYLTWISNRYPIYGTPPWLGVKPLKSNHLPNAENGKKLYAEMCADCHGLDGDGGNKSALHPGESIPPVFGKNSYNQKAGMNRPEIFASFIYHNMPLGNPSLQVSEALDIAAYIAEKPRPDGD